jgi:hypothetical protein
MIRASIQMTSVFSWLFGRLILICLSLTTPYVLAQSTAAGPTSATTPSSMMADWIAQCPSLGQAKLQPVLELCSANIVCKQVLEHRSSCSAKSTFVERLVFPGGKVTGYALWQAALPDHLRAMENRPTWKQSVDLLDESLKDFAGTPYSNGSHANGVAGFATYKMGILDGPAYFFYNNGTMRRGDYKQNLQEGVCDDVSHMGTRFIGLCTKGKADGVGLFSMPKGTVVEGFFRFGIFAEGKRLRPDGTLESQGRWAPGYQLAVGEIFDATGVRSLGYVNFLAEDAKKARSAAEQSCRDKLVIYDKEQNSKVTQSPTTDLLEKAKRVMSMAKARMDWLRIACSDWDFHMRLVWDAQDIFESAQEQCSILSRKECTLEASR